MNVGGMRWEGPTEVAAAAWRWEAAMRERAQVHDSHCGVLLLEGGGGILDGGMMVEKKKGEEIRPCLCHVPVDVLAHMFLQLSSFKDMASASRACKKWKDGMREALAFREKLSFAGWRADDCTVGRLVEGAWNLLELDISLGRWGSRITDAGLYRISKSKCCPNLTSISIWGVTGVTDEGVVQLVLNLWGCRHVTEAGILALGKSCPKLASINVWGMNMSRTCELGLLVLNPHLQLKPSQVRNHARNVIAADGAHDQ